MGRRVNIEDFEESGSLMRSLEESGVWFVCDEYEIRRDAVVAKYPYYPGGEGRWGPYRPLQAEPGLFLKFARLYEEPNFEGAVLAWSNKYGALRGDFGGRLGRKDRVPLAWFRQEAKRASVVLRMYEAALSSDAQAIRSLLSTYRNDEELGPVLSEYSDAVDILVNGASIEGFSKQDLINFAYYASIHMVNQKVRELCHPYLTPSFRFKEGRTVPNPDGTKMGWKFSDLLGAMYLQMLWMIEAGGNLTRCEDCDRIISHASPAPNKRKIRWDKRFCNDACRQRHHRSQNKS